MPWPAASYTGPIARVGLFDRLIESPQPQHIASVEVLGRSVGHVGLAIARGKAILALAAELLQ